MNESDIEVIELTLYVYVVVVNQSLLIEKFMRRMKNATFNEIISLTFTDMNMCVMLALWIKVHCKEKGWKKKSYQE